MSAIPSPSEKPSAEPSSESTESSESTGVLNADASTTGTESEAELRARLDAMLNDPLDVWLKGVHFGGGVVAGFEQTLSWKVTKPLRAARTFQIRVGQLGLPGAVAHTARYVKRRVRGFNR